MEAGERRALLKLEIATKARADQSYLASNLIMPGARPLREGYDGNMPEPGPRRFIRILPQI